MDLRKDAERIVQAALQKVMPDEAVARALTEKNFDKGRVYRKRQIFLRIF